MYALAVRQADGRIKVEMGDDIHLDPVNGGFVSLKRHGSSVGFPLGAVEDVRNTSQYEMLTDNQKKAIALGKLQEYENYGRGSLTRDASEDFVLGVVAVLNDLQERWTPKSDRPTLEASIDNHRGS